MNLSLTNIVDQFLSVPLVYLIRGSPCWSNCCTLIFGYFSSLSIGPFPPIPISLVLLSQREWSHALVEYFPKSYLLCTYFIFFCIFCIFVLDHFLPVQSHWSSWVRHSGATPLSAQKIVFCFTALLFPLLIPASRNHNTNAALDQPSRHPAIRGKDAIARLFWYFHTKDGPDWDVVAPLLCSW